MSKPITPAEMHAILEMELVFQKVNQTLDEFKADGAIPKGAVDIVFQKVNQILDEFKGAVDMTDADQEAYEARLKAALDIDKPITFHTSV